MSRILEASSGRKAQRGWVSLHTGSHDGYYLGGVGRYRQLARSDFCIRRWRITQRLRKRSLPAGSRGAWDMTFHGMLFVPLLILFVANAFAENHCPPPYETPQPIGQGKSGTVQCKELPDARLQWIIERPAVGETLTEYPQIKFE